MARCNYLGEHIEVMESSRRLIGTERVLRRFSCNVLPPRVFIEEVWSQATVRRDGFEQSQSDASEYGRVWLQTFCFQNLTARELVLIQLFAEDVLC